MPDNNESVRAFPNQSSLAPQNWRPPERFQNRCLVAMDALNPRSQMVLDTISSQKNAANMLLNDLGAWFHPSTAPLLFACGIFTFCMCLFFLFWLHVMIWCASGQLHFLIWQLFAWVVSSGFFVRQIMFIWVRVCWWFFFSCVLLVWNTSPFCVAGLWVSCGFVVS